MASALSEFERWLSKTEDDPEMHGELERLKWNDEAAYECFFEDLRFGTSGIRGILGPGTACMNRYVIRRATFGVAAYIKNHGMTDLPVVVAYDGRMHSSDFAEETVNVLSAEGIRTYLFDEITPVSVLSYAIEKLGCSFGVMITASHNPSIYNGYKVYDRRGFQITPETAEEITREIRKADFFDVPGEKSGAVRAGTEVPPAYIKENFISEILSFIPEGLSREPFRNLKVIYTPLNGAGAGYVPEVLRRAGFEQVFVVPTQKDPDPEFTTCKTPNPEKIAAYSEAFRFMDKEKGDIIIATDPDCDRLGVAMLRDGTKTMLSGNQIGLLMLDFLCSVLKPGRDKLCYKSIVITPLASEIAEAYGMTMVETLTGFKFIGEAISDLEARGEKDRFFFGFEESNGFLIRPFIKDKDGVSAALLIAMVAAVNKARSNNLLERIRQIYEIYGICHDRTRNYAFEGVSAGETMAGIMNYLRENCRNMLGDHYVMSFTDYLNEETGLPRSDVLRFELDDGNIVIIRPSGTETKIKVYYYLTDQHPACEEAVNRIMESFRS
ncbi:MAG: phospho-sugar mutase [Firmicutes bacterium]|nr:phospho-sugar mutase [Bacillota bacterium]